MKTTIKLLALVVAILPVFAHASDGSEALQRFQEKIKASFAQQAEMEKRKQQELQTADQQKKQTPATTTDKQAAN